jgi:hypothetical protein
MLPLSVSLPRVEMLDVVRNYIEIDEILMKIGIIGQFFWKLVILTLEY